MAFSGLPKDTVPFLKELEKNNNKTFFDANKARFEKIWVEPARELVIAVGNAIQKFAPSIQFEPKVGGSMMRMNRDIRFSKDKSPYKTHLDLWFWDGEDKGWGTAGFFFRLTKDQLMCGAGMHGFEKDALARYREAVGNDESGARLAKIVSKLEKAGVEVGREDYKKVPKPFPADHARARLLRFGALHASIHTKIPAELHSASLVPLLVKNYKTAEPLRSWLAGALG